MIALLALYFIKLVKKLTLLTILNFVMLKFTFYVFQKRKCTFYSKLIFINKVQYRAVSLLYGSKHWG